MGKKPSGTTGQVSEEAVAASELMELIGGFQISQAIYVPAKLDVYTTLADRPLPINEIAEAVGADADILRRLIRTMAPMGLFRRLENDVVELTSKGGLLSRTHPASLRAIAGGACGRRHRWRGRHGAHTATRRRGGPDRHRS